MLTRESWGRIVIGNDVSIGSGANIGGQHLRCARVIGAGSVVTKSITEKACGRESGETLRRL